MQGREKDGNLKVYEDPEVVRYYSELTALQECERYILGRYLADGADILDIGVGGGRTTPYLASRAQSYVGIDYSAEMVQLCRSKFPGVRFETVDATDMALFADASFDTLLFSFNGIDMLHPDESRLRCLKECHRVLRPGGVLIFSRHNARAVLVYPQLAGVGPVKKGWRVVRSLYKTARLAMRTVPTATFRNGIGYLLDPTHGGLVTHLSTPEHVLPELSACGFEVAEVVNGNYPARTTRYAVPWYYFVARK